MEATVLEASCLTLSSFQQNNFDYVMRNFASTLLLEKYALASVASRHCFDLSFFQWSLLGIESADKKRDLLVTAYDLSRLDFNKYQILFKVLDIETSVCAVVFEQFGNTRLQGERRIYCLLMLQEQVWKFHGLDVIDLDTQTIYSAPDPNTWDATLKEAQERFALGISSTSDAGDNHEDAEYWSKYDHIAIPKRKNTQEEQVASKKIKSFDTDDDVEDEYDYWDSY